MPRRELFIYPPMTHPLEAALRGGLAELELRLSDGQVRQLLDYLSLLQKWNKVYNLTACLLYTSPSPRDS